MGNFSIPWICPACGCSCQTKMMKLKGVREGNAAEAWCVQAAGQDKTLEDINTMLAGHGLYLMITGESGSTGYLFSECLEFRCFNTGAEVQNFLDEQERTFRYT